MITSKERIAKEKERQAEYTEYRGILSGIAKDTEAADADRVHAIELINTIDREREYRPYIIIKP